MCLLNGCMQHGVHDYLKYALAATKHCLRWQTMYPCVACDSCYCCCHGQVKALCCNPLGGVPTSYLSSQQTAAEATAVKNELKKVCCTLSSIAPVPVSCVAALVLLPNCWTCMTHLPNSEAIVICMLQRLCTVIFRLCCDCGPQGILGLELAFVGTLWSMSKRLLFRVTTL